MEKSDQHINIYFLRKHECVHIFNSGFLNSGPAFGTAEMGSFGNDGWSIVPYAGSGPSTARSAYICDEVSRDGRIRSSRFTT